MECLESLPVISAIYFSAGTILGLCAATLFLMEPENMRMVSPVIEETGEVEDESSGEEELPQIPEETVKSPDEVLNDTINDLMCSLTKKTVFGTLGPNDLQGVLNLMTSVSSPESEDVTEQLINILKSKKLN